MAKIPSTYNDLLRKLNAMGSAGGFTIKQDDKFPDRATIQDSNSKKKMTLNLTRADADRGSVWLVGSDSGDQQKIITPRITADRQGEVGMDYESDIARINYRATSSTGILSGMIYQSFNRAGKGGDPMKYFRSLISKGDEELGLRPAPDVPRGHKATQNLAINQIDFRMTSNGETVRSPDEAFEIKEDFMAQQANAANPAFSRKRIENDLEPLDVGGKTIKVSRDARLIGFQYLNKGRYEPNEHGRLEPIAGTEINSVQASGQWMLNAKPKTIAKSNKLTFSSDPATPYQMVGSTENPRNRLPVPMQAKPTTNTNRPALAISNAIMPNETKGRSYERQNYVFDNMPVPGAAIAYHDPSDVKADFWGTESNVDVKIPSLNYAKVISGEQKLDIAKGYQSRSHGGGKPSSVLGHLTTGDDKPDPVLGRFGPGIWRSTGSHSLTLPMYVNPTSGKFSSEQKEGYVETEGLNKDLQKAMPGMDLQYGRVASPTLSFGGVNESSTSAKGQQIKASEIFTGIEQENNGQRVTRFTGELKGNAFLYGYYGGMNYNQLTGLAKQWEKRTPGMGAKVGSYLKENYGEAAKAGRELNVDYNQMATDLGYEGGGGGLGMLNDWFSQTIRAAKPGSTTNRRNIERYGAGYASGTMQLGVVHGDQLEHMRDNYRRANPNLSPEEADKAFGKTFKMQPRGTDEQGRPLYTGSQKLSKSAMFVSMLNARRIENVHGPRMTQDWIQAVSKKYPEFASQIGANVDSFQPQGATQSSAAGIMKYAIWQGSKRDYLNDKSIQDNGDRPTNLTEISDDKLSDIQAHLSALSSEESSPIEKLRSVVEKHFPEEGDSSADTLLYNKTTDQYLPNPRAILNSTFSELGVEASGLAKPTVDLLSKLGGIAGDNELSPAQKVRQGLSAAAPLQEAAENLITGSGNFMKRLLGTNIRSAVSGRTGGALNLANDEAHMDYNMALMSAKQMGFKEQQATRKAREIMRSGASYVSARQPMGTGEVESRNLINEDVYAKERFVSPEAYENVRSNPLARGQIDMPVSQATSEIGDFDRDPISGALGLNRVGDELKTIEDPKVRADVMTAEKVKAIEENIFPDEGMRNMVNANVKQLTDLAEGKDVVGSALSQKGSYSAQEVLTTAWDRLMNKTLGMGVGYNPRRAVGGAMASGGYNAKEIANVMSSMPGLYQPALDTALTGREATGVRAASIIARPYFHSGPEQRDENGKVIKGANGKPLKDRLLRVSMTGEKLRNDTRMPILDENGEAKGFRILTKGQSPKTDVDLDKLMGGKNPQELLNFGRFVSEGFASGYNLNGKQVGMSASQYGGWFAAPGDSEALAEKLGKADTGQWGDIVTDYQRQLYRGVTESGGTHMAGVEKVLSTPAMMSILTRASSKAQNQRNPLTGKERIEGATEGYQLLAGNTSSDFVNRLTTAVASHDVEHRTKGMNLRSLYPSNLRKAAENMGQGVKGSAMRMFSRVMDVGFGPTAVQNTPATRRPDPVAYEGKTLQAKLGGSDAMQAILDKMAAEVQSGNTGPVEMSEDEQGLLSQARAEIPTSGNPVPTPAPTDEPDLIEQKRANAQQVDDLLRGKTSTPPGGGGKPPRKPPVSDADFNLDDDGSDDGPRKNNPLPAQAQQELREKREGTARRIGYSVQAAHTRAMEYEEKRPSAIGYMDAVLNKLGYKETNPEAKMPGSVRDRTQQAMIKDRSGLLSAMDPEMLTQIRGLEEHQKKSALALAQSANAPGLGLRGSQIQTDLAAAVSPGSKYGDDIFALASFKGIEGAEKVKNPYMLEDAMGLAQESGFQSLYGALKPVIGQRGGAGKNLKQIREVLAQHPDSVDMLKMAKGMSTESPGNLPPEISQMAGLAKSLEKRDPGLMKTGGEVTQLTTEQIDKLTKAYTEQSKAAGELLKVTEKTTTAEKEKLTFESRKANAAYQEQIYGVLQGQQQRKVDKLQDKLAQQGTLASFESTQLEGALRKTEAFGKKRNEAIAESQSVQEEETAGKSGMAARRMLGGFGLMYMRSIFGLATSGMGYGSEQRQQYNQIQQGAVYQATGERNLQQSQEQILQNKMALSGSNYNAIAGIKQVFADQPIARDAYNMGAAGIGAWGYSQFAADQLKHMPGGKWLSQNSVGIGLAAASVSMFADSYARSKDPTSLGQRLETGKAGLNDVWAYGMAGLKDGGLADVERSRAAMKLTNTAAERGLTFEQMQNTQIDFIGKSKFNLVTGRQDTERTSGMAGDIFTKGEMFAANNAFLQDKNINLDQAAVAQANIFQQRNNVAISDDRLTGIAEDYQFGGWAAQTSQQALAGLGYNTKDMFTRKPGAEFDRQSGLQDRYANGVYGEEQKATMSAGIQMLGQMKGASYIEGVGKYSKSEVTDEKIDKFIEALGKIADSKEGETFVSEQNASYAARRAGMAYKAPDINESFEVTGGERGEVTYGAKKQLTEVEATQRQALASSVEASANTRIATAQGFAQNQMNMGNTQLAESGYEFLMGGERGDQWRRSRAINGDPLMMANMAAGGVNLSAAPKLTNIQGREIDASYLANTDTSNEGRVTGLPWSTTGLQRGSISAEQMGKNIFGGMNNLGTRAMIQGVELPQAVTLGDGKTKVERVAGQMGLRVQGDMLEQQYQQKSMALQNKGVERDYAYQMKVWGIQDQQRALGHGHQMKQFEFQEQGMQLQQEGIEMQNKFFWQGAGLQQRQTNMTRSWTREDWGYQDMTRNMQWGWKNEDFQEESRFMTGRQRKLAERGMKRENVMHNLEEDQIQKGRGRQAELWKLEDERFTMQKQQHVEGVAMQNKQLELQRQQFAENKKFYLESKKLEDEMIALQRAHWLEEHKAAKEQIALTQEHQKAMLELKIASDQFAIAEQLINGEMNTLVDDSLAKFQQWIVETAGILAPFLSGASSGGGLPSAATVAQNSTASYYNNQYSSPTTSNAATLTTTTRKGKAAGGPTYQSSLNVIKTGEKGWEYIVNGEVIPHDQSKEMEKSGILPGAPTADAMAFLSGSDANQQSPSQQVAPQFVPFRDSSTSSQPQVINVYVGSEKLASMVVDIVGKELKA